MENTNQDTQAAAPPAPVNMFAALARAQAACSGVEKASENKHHRYKYASAEDVIDAATQAMGPHGLALVCTSWVPDNPAAPRAITASYLLTHEAGTLVLGPYSLTVHPDKGRPMDKAITTCLTYLQAYCLRGILNIPRVEEGSERDSTDDQMIQAWHSEQQKERKARETRERKEHAANKKLLALKSGKVKEACPDFLKAAGVSTSQKSILDLTIWASSVAEWPSRDLPAQIAACDEAWAYLAAWANEDEPDAMADAQRFAVECGYTTPTDAPPGFE